MCSPRGTIYRHSSIKFFRIRAKIMLCALQNKIKILHLHDGGQHYCGRKSKNTRWTPWSSHVSSERKLTTTISATGSWIIAPRQHAKWLWHRGHSQWCDNTCIKNCHTKVQMDCFCFRTSFPVLSSLTPVTVALLEISARNGGLLLVEVMLSKPYRATHVM